MKETKFNKECVWCKNPFTTKREKTRFCSQHCATKWQQTFNKAPRKGWVDYECIQCHKIFQDWKSNAKRKFCNNSCKILYLKKHPNNYQAKRQTALCKICSQEFTYYSSVQPNAQYCSNKCRQVDHKNKMGIKNGKWKGPWKNPNTFLARVFFENKCVICGWDETACDVHHIISVKKGGSSLLGNLIILCPNHHRMAEKNLISKEYLQQLWVEKYSHLQLDDALIH